jgi:E3 ubiquitin-protein ligase RGLG
VPTSDRSPGPLEISVMTVLAAVFLWIAHALCFGLQYKNLAENAQQTRLSGLINDAQSSLSLPSEPFKNLAQVQAALQHAGLESSNLILGIDFTKSNTWKGKNTFDGFCLHDTSRKGVENPYQRVMRIVAKSLPSYDEDNMIPAFGFGDIHTASSSCFPFYPDRPCNGFSEALTRYNEIVDKIELAGPTNFAPVSLKTSSRLVHSLHAYDLDARPQVIRKAIEIVRSTSKFHILLIVADGQVDKEQETVAAIVEASRCALSIVCVGVGDGPWEMMRTFDDKIYRRQFDNFQFVEFHTVESENAELSPERLEAEFACAVLMEIPQQFREMKRLGLL